MNKSNSTQPRVPASNGEESNKPGEVAPSESLNPYQPQDFWIDPSTIHGAAAVKKILTTVEVRPPKKHEFFRVHGGQDFWRPVALLELGRDLFLILPRIVQHLDPADFFYAYLCLAVTKSGLPFFWPVKVPNSERRNEWTESALGIARLAVDKWVKRRSRQDIGGGYYEAEEPIGIFKEPVWPNLSQKELLDIAFKGGRIIDRIDHEAILKITGQIQ
jgi:hypothetical protein